MIFTPPAYAKENSALNEVKANLAIAESLLNTLLSESLAQIILKPYKKPLISEFQESLSTAYKSLMKENTRIKHIVANPNYSEGLRFIIVKEDVELFGQLFFRFSDLRNKANEVILFDPEKTMDIPVSLPAAIEIVTQSAPKLIETPFKIIDPSIHSFLETLKDNKELYNYQKRQKLNEFCENYKHFKTPDEADILDKELTQLTLKFVTNPLQ